MIKAVQVDGLFYYASDLNHEELCRKLFFDLLFFGLDALWVLNDKKGF